MKKDELEPNSTQESVLLPATTTSEARREFLARLGRYALYTAPLFLEMNIPTASAADESAPPPP